MTEGTGGNRCYCTAVGAHGSGGRQEALAHAGKMQFAYQFGPHVVQSLDRTGLFVPKPMRDVMHHHSYSGYPGGGIRSLGGSISEGR
jgi:hypothetical protein